MPDLPEGFQLDAPSLPEGFQLDTPSAPSGDRWAATVARAQGDFLHPVKPTGTGLGAVAERLAQYPRIALGQVTDVGQTLGKVLHGEIDATDPRAIQAAAEAAMMATPAGEFAGTGAQIARRAGIGKALPGEATPGFRPPTPDLKAPQPSVDEIKTAARSGYQSPEVTDVRIRPEAVSDLGAKIENDLTTAGFREGTTPKTFSVVKELNVPEGVQAVSVADLDSARRAFGRIATERDAVGAATAEAAAAARGITHIDEFLPNLKQADLLAGDAARANEVLGEARANWKSAKQSELAQTKMENARIQAASTYGGGNINNALRQAYRPLEVNNYAKTANWSPEAQAALKDVVEGRFLRNAARDIGRSAPTGPVNIGFHLAGGVPTAVATGGASILPQAGVAAATYVAKKLGERGTKNAARRLDQLLRSESPLARSQVKPPPPQVPNTKINALMGGGVAAATTPADAERQLQESELEAYIARRYPWSRQASIPGM